MRNHAGKVIGGFTVIRHDRYDTTHGHHYWVTKCNACGGESIRTINKAHAMKSCGCIRIQRHTLLTMTKMDNGLLAKKWVKK